jgi:hypothetical protein
MERASRQAVGGAAVALSNEELYGAMGHFTNWRIQSMATGGVNLAELIPGVGSYDSALGAYDACSQ